MTARDDVRVERCTFCGKEFDARRFQVLVAGSRGTYHSAECALLDAPNEPTLRTLRRGRRGAGAKRG